MTGRARREFASTLLSQPALCLAEVYKKRGEVHDHTGIYEKAKCDYNRARYLYSSVGCKTECGEIDHAVGNMLLNMGAFDQAEDIFNRALNYFKSAQDDINIAKCFKELGKLYQYEEKPDAALSLFDKSLQIYKRLRDVEGENIIMEYMADVYRIKGDFSQALFNVSQLDHYYKDTNQFGTLCRITKLTGKIYMEKGENDLSRAYFNRAYQYTLKTGESSLAMYILCDLGLACYYIEKYEEASSYFAQCLELAEKLDSNYMRVVILVNIADTLFKMGKIERSKKYIGRAATINHNIGGLNSEIKRIQEEIAQKEGGQGKTG